MISQQDKKEVNSPFCSSGVLCKEEGIIPQKLDDIIQDYLFSGKEPLRDTIIGSLEQKPSLLQRKPIGERILTKMMDFVDTFINGVPTKAKVYELPGDDLMIAAEGK